jgi:hypothetical protein
VVPFLSGPDRGAKLLHRPAGRGMLARQLELGDHVLTGPRRFLVGSSDAGRDVGLPGGLNGRQVADAGRACCAVVGNGQLERGCR